MLKEKKNVTYLSYGIYRCALLHSNVLSKFFKEGLCIWGWFFILKESSQKT